MISDIQAYEYKPSWLTIILCGAFFSMTAFVLGSAALHNDSGLVINQIIQFGTSGATAFYWALTLASVAFVSLAAMLVYHRVSFQQRLILGADSLLVPASRWSRDTKKIAYRDIKKLSILTVSHQRFLKITYSGGKYKVNASMLSSKRLFEDFCEHLGVRVYAEKLQ